MGTRYHLPIALIGKPTGDGRQFAEGALTSRDLPLPYRYVHKDSGGHKDAEIVGRIDKIDPREPGTTDPYQWADIEFYDDDEWPDQVRDAATIARKFHEEKVVGPSVDLDQADSEMVPDPAALQHATKQLKNVAVAQECGCDYSQAVVDSVPRINLVRSGRVASVTSVHIPAFAELSGHAIPIQDGQEFAAGKMIRDSHDEAAENIDPDHVHKKGCGHAGYASGFPTDGVDVIDFAMDTIGGKRVNRAKIDTEDFGDPAARKFPITNQASVSSAAHLIGKAGDPNAVRARIVAICKRKGLTPPPEWTSGNTMTAGATTAPLAPPAAWFANPALTEPTPLHIGEDGRVYGHLALWDSCHVGFGDTCIKPPRSDTGYAYFHAGEVISAEGERIPAGHLTYGAGHAEHNLGFRAAAEHYDNSAHTGAVARAGEDEFGIWVAGAMVPDADEKAWAIMRRSPLSGDWRRVGGNLELVAALHVNTPGFGVPRVVVSSGLPQTLVAGGAFGPQPLEAVPHTADGQVDVNAIALAVWEQFEKKRKEENRAKQWETLVAAAKASGAIPDRQRYAQVQEELLMALIADLGE